MLIKSNEFLECKKSILFFLTSVTGRKEKASDRKKTINQYFVLIRLLQKTQVIANSDSLIKRNNLNKIKKRPKKEY